MPPHSVECAYLNRTSWDAFSQGIGYMPFVSLCVCLFFVGGYVPVCQVNLCIFASVNVHSLRKSI